MRKVVQMCYCFSSSMQYLKQIQHLYFCKLTVNMQLTASQKIVNYL